MYADEFGRPPADGPGGDQARFANEAFRMQANAHKLWRTIREEEGVKMLPKRVIGILTWRQGQRFGEPDYLRKLVLAGQKLGAEIYLFSHQDVHGKEKKIRGFVPMVSLAGGGY